MPKSKKELTDKEYAFITHYLRDYNGARAARLAGYCPNKPQNARFEANRLLTKDHIKAHIDEHKAALLKECMVEEKDILQVCKEIILADITDYYDPDLYDIKVDKDSPNKRAIQSIKVTTKITESGETRSEQLTLRDPIRAADRVAKLLNLDKQPEDNLDKEFNINVHIVRDREDVKKEEK